MTDNLKPYDEMSLVERWEATGLLAGVNDQKVKESVAACLEAQRVYNEEDNSSAPWKRVSIPVIRRAIATSEAVKRNTFVENKESSESAPEVYVFNTKYQGLTQPGYELTAEQKQWSLDAEAEAVAEFSYKFKEEFDRLFKDQYKKKIYFKGLSCTNEGTVCLRYNLL